MNDDKLMTVADVASYLQLNKQTVTRMAVKKELPAIKLGREWRFRREYLDAMLNEELKKQLCK